MSIRKKQPPAAKKAFRPFEPLEARTLLSGGVVINEIHYHPDVKTEAVEFVELTNPGNAAVNLTGAAFTDGIDYAFPSGTTLQPGDYLVVARNPPAFQQKFGFTPLGPFGGKLGNDGDNLKIQDASGNTLDRVDYGAGFPWPTVGDAPGYSIELINPTLDNDLGGNWRSHGAQPVGNVNLIAAGSTWSYRKGTSEASSPRSAWREPGFALNGSWSSGAGPFGYDPTVAMWTTLSDMSGSYASVYLRKTFNVSNPSQFSTLRLEALYDDGFNVWINGTNVLRQGMSSSSPAYNATASVSREDGSFSTFALNNPASYLVAGTNVIAVQFHNVSLSSSDAFFDARLTGVSGGDVGGPTPGAINANFAVNAPPSLRQVQHAPETPQSGQPVTITAKATDPNGVSSVTLQYQVVDPGSYINYSDPAYQTNWTAAAMRDDGTNGDAAAGDSIYTAVLPGSLQVHRRMIRYRIVSTDGLGASVTGPYPDDPQSNFAYFCFNGNPAWTGSARPGVSPSVTYGADVMNSIPNFILLSKKADAENATWYSGYTGSDYLWTGSVVYNGKVYDNVAYRARGGVWRYAMGKNAWKFNFPGNHPVKMLDNNGQAFPGDWDKVNLRPLIQQRDYLHRGEQGLFESVGWKLFQLAGVPAANTSFVQLRVIDSASETGTDQYSGDLWGLYLAVENYDEHFKDAHRLPDGNLWDMEQGEPGGGTLQAQGATLPSDNSDLVSYTNTYKNTTPSDQWWRDNLDLDEYYSYRGIVEAIHHYDVDQGAGKNYEYFHRPVDSNDPLSNKWQVFPWDLDLTWADNMYGGGDEPYRGRVLPRSAFSIAYKNRMRELRNLLYNSEQTGQLIDEMASFISTPGQPSFVDVDRALWDYNPTMVDGSKHVQTGKAGYGAYYQGGSGQPIPAPGGFAGMAQKMKNYILSRGSYIDSSIAADPAIPSRPSLSFIGTSGYPADDLRFRSSNFSGNGGAFAAMRWRIAEVTDPNNPIYTAAPRHYEITPTWESGDLTSFSSDIRIPTSAAAPGHTYRARVRMKDSTGRWSDWSAPVQFVAAAPNVSAVDALRITEIMYHPPDAPNNIPVDDEFEYIELQNISGQPLDLAGVKFTQGFDLTFGAVTLAPGAYGVVVRNQSAFESRYGVGAAQILGAYSGQVLDNGGERVRLEDAAMQTILDFSYDDVWHPQTDGGGYSLHIIDAAAPVSSWGSAASWRPSTLVNGSPGAAEAPPSVSSVQINDGSAQRSVIRTITVNFDRPVVLDSSAFTLAGRNGAGAGTIVTASNPQANPLAASSVWFLSFSGSPVIGGSLEDGIYDLTVIASKVHAGDSTGPAMAANYAAPAFHRLFSDADGDGDSDNMDLFQLRGTYNKFSGDPAYKAFFDYTADGRVDNSDVFQVRSRRPKVFKNF